MLTSVTSVVQPVGSHGGYKQLMFILVISESPSCPVLSPGDLTIHIEQMRRSNGVMFGQCVLLLLLSF